MTHNKKEKGNVPNLRFPEFNGEWESTSLAKESIINPKTTTLENTFIYIDLESVVKGELVNINHISKDEAPSRAQRVLSDNDILFQCVRPYQLNNYIYHLHDDKQWVASTGYAQIRTTHNVAFIYQLLNSPRFNQNVMLRCTGTSYPAIASTDLGNIPISVCTKAEQEKIGSFLSLIDQRIETQNKIIEELKKLKTALVDGLYASYHGSPKLRLPKFSKKWQSYIYADLLRVSTTRNTDYSIRRILSASQVHGMVERSEIDIDIKFEQESTRTYKIVLPGDYIIHLRSFQGGFAFSNTDGICSPAYTVLRPSSLLRYGFLKDYFMSSSFIKSLKIVTYGIRDGRSISVEEFLKLPITIPAMNEQEEIDKVLTTISAKIENEVKAETLLILQKQQLLKQMFI